MILTIQEHQEHIIIKLYNSSTFVDSNWDGATAQVIVGASGSVTSFKFNLKDLDTISIIMISSLIIVKLERSRWFHHNYNCETQLQLEFLQITGFSTITDSYYRIVNVIDEIKVAVAKTSGDPAIIPDQFTVNVGPSLKSHRLHLITILLHLIVIISTIFLLK